MFGLVAVATGHEHWLKEHAEVMPITGPLNAWVDQLPSKTLKRVEKNLAPCLFVLGCAVVAGPDIAAEIRLRAETKRARLAVSQPPFGAGFRPAAAHAPSGSPTGPSNGASGPARGEGGWSSSIPAAPSISGEWDV